MKLGLCNFCFKVCSRHRTVTTLSDHSMQCSPEKATCFSGFDHALASGKRGLWSDTTEELVNNVEFAVLDKKPMGPTTQWGRLGWSDDQFQRLDPDMKDRLIRNLGRLRHKDYFSGSASVTQIWTQIVETVNRFTGGALPDVITTNSTELQQCRRDHINRLVRGRPHHCSGDIFDRLPHEVKAEMLKKAPVKEATTCARKLANRQSAEYIYKQYAQRGADMSRGDCDWHPGECCDMHGEGGLANEELMTSCTGGIPCVDSSTMNQHASGDGGRTFLCTSVFLAERAFCLEDWSWLECTYRWSTGLVRERMPPEYSVSRLSMKGSDVGDTYDRPRCGCLVMNERRLVLTRRLDEYLLYAGAEPIFPVNAFWNCSDDDQAREIEALSTKRVTPVDEDLTWHDVLLPSQRDRKRVYDAQIKTAIRLGKLLPHEPVVYDLDQNPAGGRGRMKFLSVSQKKCFLPTLIQHGVIWNTAHGRQLSAVDMLKVHGWPIEPEECKYFGSCASWRDNINAGLVSHNQVIAMCGDSWHIPVQGRFLMWLLSVLDLRETAPAVPRSPKAAFAQPLVLGKRARMFIDCDDENGIQVMSDDESDAEGEVASPNSWMSVTVHGTDSEATEPENSVSE